MSLVQSGEKDALLPSAQEEKPATPFGTHYRVEGIFVVCAKDGRRLTDRAAFERASQMMSAAVRSGNDATLEQIDDCLAAAQTVRFGRPMGGFSLLDRYRAGASS